MEEQEESATPWYERNLAKSATWFLTNIVALATVIGVAHAMYKDSTAPTISLTATYQESQFSFPEKLSNTDYIDSVLIGRDRLITQLRKQLQTRIGDKEWATTPDALRFSFPEPFLVRAPLDDFVSRHRFFYTLIIKNEGDKPIDEIHIIHSSEAHYEFRDSRGVLRDGESAGKLPIGDLAATEVREVRLWVSNELVHNEKGLVITFPNGKIQANPITIQGLQMVSVEPASSLWGRNILYLIISATVLLLVKILKPLSIRRN
jgi:hypothetical protein